LSAAGLARLPVCADAAGISTPKTRAGVSSIAEKLVVIAFLCWLENLRLSRLESLRSQARVDSHTRCAAKFFLEASCHSHWNEARYVAAHGSDLAHQCGGDRADRRRRRQKDRLYRRGHDGVHARHFHLIIEIRRAAQPSAKKSRPFPLRGSHHQARECDALKIAPTGL